MTDVESEVVLVDTTRPHVAVVTLNRPDQLNALNIDMVQSLQTALDEIAVDRTIRVVVLTGAGRAFCAGLDLKGYGDPARDVEMGRTLATLERQREIANLTMRLHTMPQPVIAAVNGAAAGGGLALVCASDVRICAPSAVFAVSFIRAGYSGCDIGISWLLPRLIGAARAHELMLTGRRFVAEEAKDFGLVTDVSDDAVGAALLKADEIMLNPPASVALTKQGMWLALETPGLAAAIELENRQQVITALTEDQPEATAAFLHKRPPIYHHR